MKKIACLLMLILMLMYNTVIFAGSDFEVPETILVKLNDGSIEEIDLDTYLYSVVQSEMGVSYRAKGMSSSAAVPLESLKAQAVASRSYAVYQILNSSANAAYHVTSTTSSQVYKDNINIRDIVKEAVDSTSGQVVLYDGKIACTYFYSTSGGHTEASENVWTAALPYLRGVSDEYEIEVENCSNWTRTFTFDELKVLFPYVGEIEDIEILKRSENDRVIELEITGSKGSKVLKKNSIRTTMGASKIRSQWFDVEIEDDEAIFTGKGYGHGVGMSQNGAIGMGLEGFEYNEIIHWYYTDVEILGEKVGSSQGGRPDTTVDDKDDYIYEEEEVIDIPTPLLDATTSVLTTNWLQAILFGHI
ncbi:MAG: SpoIID/LytB domain-containing protein [Clostridia bacterium]|nr:SpoIID/LytB domain-containing protein [Clostridia bacterium]